MGARIHVGAIIVSWFQSEKAQNAIFETHGL